MGCKDFRIAITLLLTNEEVGSLLLFLSSTKHHSVILSMLFMLTKTYYQAIIFKRIRVLNVNIYNNNNNLFNLL